MMAAKSSSEGSGAWKAIGAGLITGAVFLLREPPDCDESEN